MILLTGGTGLLGTYIQRVLQKNNEEFLAPSKEKLDISSKKSVQGFFKTFSPKKFSKIIHTAAFTNTQAAQTQQETCTKINVQGVKYLAETQIPIIHFSSDFVFGNQKSSWNEDDTPNPLNFYGESKFLAEKVLKNSGGKYWNIRVSSLYGGSNDFVSKIRKKSLEKKPISVVKNIFTRPTFAFDVAENLYKNFIQKEKPVGNYHLQAEGLPVSWAELAKKILRQTKDESMIIPVASKETSSKIIRAKYGILVNTKLKEKMPNWEISFDQYLRDSL